MTSMPVFYEFREGQRVRATSQFSYGIQGVLEINQGDQGTIQKSQPYYKTSTVGVVWDKYDYSRDGFTAHVAFKGSIQPINHFLEDYLFEI